MKALSHLKVYRVSRETIHPGPSMLIPVDPHQSRKAAGECSSSSVIKLHPIYHHPDLVIKLCPPWCEIAENCSFCLESAIIDDILPCGFVCPAPHWCPKGVSLLNSVTGGLGNVS